MCFQFFVFNSNNDNKPVNKSHKHNLYFDTVVVLLYANTTVCHADIMRIFQI